MLSRAQFILHLPLGTRIPGSPPPWWSSSPRACPRACTPCQVLHRFCQKSANLIGRGAGRRSLMPLHVPSVLATTNIRIDLTSLFHFSQLIVPTRRIIFGGGEHRENDPDRGGNSWLCWLELYHGHGCASQLRPTLRAGLSS